MELVLTHHSETEIAVSCDGAPSHRFELAMVFPMQAGPDVPPAPLEDPLGYGAAVYAALFGADTPASRALEALPERVVVVATDPDLHSVPWEYAYGPNGWVVTEVPFVRGLPAEKRVASAVVDQPLHVVVVPSQPLSGGMAPLDTEGEWVRLTEIINATDNEATLERTVPATLTQLRRLLAGERQRVIHFTGHGGQDAEGALLFFEREIGDLSADEVNASGNVEAVSAREFIKHIRGTAHLVVLSACVSATPGETAFNNLAASLVEHKTPYALGMRFSVIDVDANTFCRSFYDELARGVPIEEAVRQGRLALADSQRAWAIGVPVLYTALQTAAPAFVRREGSPSVITHRPRIDLETLPQATGALHGRDDRLLGLEWFLTGDRRQSIVTIHGPSGQGKTALARAGAERIAYEWPGGVLALSFETLPTKAQVLQEIGRFIGAEGDALADPAAAEAAAEAYFADQRTLLVLDAAESLVTGVENDDPAAIELAQWLQQLPGRRVGLLVTSRRYLGWEGELGVELAGLAPEQGARLFHQNAPQRWGEVDQEQAMALSAQVGGHPLSLRLLGGAFNETDTPLAEFVADFEDRLDRAENKYVQASHRQLTLQTSINTSVSVLSAERRELLSSVWAFHSPFTPASLAGLVHGEPSDEQAEEIAASLHHLWQHSLVERVQYTDGAMMYRIHPVLRQYFRRHLPQSIDQAALDANFAAAMARLAFQLYDTRGDDPTWTTYASECREDLNRAAEMQPKDERARYAERWGWLCFLLDDYDRAAELFEGALPWAKKHDQELHAVLLDNLGSVKSVLGAYDEAIEAYKKALTILRKGEDRLSEALSLVSLAECYGNLEDYSSAKEHYKQALKLFRQEEQTERVAMTQRALGIVYRSAEQPEKAVEAFEAALKIYGSLGDGAGQAAATQELGATYLGGGEFDLAVERFQQALALFEAAEDADGRVQALTGLARAASAQERFADALALFQQVLAIHEAGGGPLEQAFDHAAISACNVSLGQAQAAVDALNAAGPLFETAGYAPGVAMVLRRLGIIIMQANSDPAAGAQWLGQAVACMEANELTEDSDGVALDAIREYQLQCAQQAAAAAAEPAAG
ncbi:MAG TPA: tetratricopeptide repeat protein [Herpetosiphonaceae bacterium]|nr:tetratricopeptide repeat protein [Herpetosiphonaceae bacterium]